MIKDIDFILNLLTDDCELYTALSNSGLFEDESIKY